MSTIARVHAHANVGAAMARAALLSENVSAGGLYRADAWAPVPHLLREYIEMRDQAARLPVGSAQRHELQRQLGGIPLELKWSDGFHNLVTTEGKNALLTHFLKGATYTAAQTLGLIEDTGYTTGVAAGNTAANITAAGGGSPANGWNEAPVGTAAARGTPSFGTAGSGSLATSSAVAFSILATDTIKGAFLMCRSVAGTAPATTVGSTAGALYSAGLFSGGDRAVANGDTLNVTYTASA